MRYPEMETYGRYVATIRYRTPTPYSPNTKPFLHIPTIWPYKAPTDAIPHLWSSHVPNLCPDESRV
jgi:hypothetical protein